MASSSYDNAFDPIPDPEHVIAGQQGASEAPTGPATPISNTQGVIPRDTPTTVVNASNGFDPAFTPIPPPPSAADQINQQVKDFDYSQSPLRHIMSESTARAVVQAALKEQGVKDTLGGNITSAGLSFLNDNVKNHMATALQAMGSKSTWDDLASQYGAMRQAQDKENPTTAAIGQTIGQAGPILAGGLSPKAAITPWFRLGQPSTIYPAIGKAAATAASAVLPIAQKAARWVLYGSALGMGHKMFDKMTGG